MRPVRERFKTCAHLYISLNRLLCVMCYWCLYMHAFKIISKIKREGNENSRLNIITLNGLFHMCVESLNVCLLMWKWKRDGTSHSTTTKTRRQKKRREQKRFKISCRSCDHTLSSIIQLVVRFRSQNNTFKIETALLLQSGWKECFLPCVFRRIIQFSNLNNFFVCSFCFFSNCCVFCVWPFLFIQNFSLSFWFCWLFKL